MSVVPGGLSRPLAPLALLLALLVPAAPLRAQQALEEVFPETAPAVLLLDDMAALKQRFGASSFGRMLADAALDGFRSQVATAWGRAGERTAETTGVDVTALLGMVQGEIGLAVLELRADPGPGRLDAALALVVRVGADAELFADGLDRLVDWFVEEQDLVLRTETVADDVPVGVLLDPGAEEPAQLAYAVAEESLVVVLGDGALSEASWLEELVLGLRGEGRSALADAPAWRPVTQRPERALRLMVDLGRMVEEAELLEGLPDDEGPMAFADTVRALDPRNLGVLRSGGDLGAEGTRSWMTLDFRSREGVLPRVLAAAAASRDPALLRWMPPEVELAMAADLDLTGLWDAVLAEMARKDPEVLRESVAAMARAEEQIGFNPRDDLLENLDGQLGFFVAGVPPEENLPMLPPGEDPMNFALLLGLRDGAAMRTMLDAAIRKQGAHAARRREEFEGYEVYLVPTGIPGFSPAYAVLDDLFVVSLSPALVKDVLRRKLSADLPAVTTSPGYADARALLPDAELLVFEPGRASGEGFLESLAMLKALLEEGQELPLDLPPLLRDVLEALAAVEVPDRSLAERFYEGPGLSSLSVDAQGLVFESIAP